VKINGLSVYDDRVKKVPICFRILLDDRMTFRRRLGGDLNVFFLNPLTCASGYRTPRSTFFTIYSTASYQFTERGTDLDV
jgi:hypothetical protein